jgi:hypothetical protein
MTLAPFVRTGPGVHPSIDFVALKRCYPDLPPDVWNITSASDIIGWEVMRERHGIADPDAVPCDLFVWGTGEPPDRRLTRVGGVPWLPKRTPWPLIGDVVTTFLCQFDFRDGRDLKGQRAAGPLPGDLLLVFVAEEESVYTADENQMRFLWVSANETEVYTAADVPEPTASFEFVTAWGARYRTQDVPTKWEQAYEIRENEAGGRSSMLPILWGTKIGGVPYHSQENFDEVPPNYLCQLVSIQASDDTKWPWIDREEPLNDRFGNDGIYARKNDLMIGDMGEMSFYLSDDGRVTVESAC